MVKVNAAEYFLLYLLSRVIKRIDVTVVGSVAINFRTDPGKTGEASEIAQYIQRILNELTRSSFIYQLKVDTLNKDHLPSKKNHESGEMNSGLLQLCPQTYLHINECTLEQGKLIENGVRNLQSIQAIITDQHLYYDFQYQRVEVFTNYPLHTVSAGKSLFTGLLSVKIENPKIDEKNVLGLIMADENLLRQLRVYIALLASPYLDVEIPEDTNKRIQQDYVESRAKDQSINVSDLSIWITLSRLYALSMGDLTVSSEHYNKVKELENWRRSMK